MAEARLVNSFLIGADPEFVFTNPPTLFNGMHIRRASKVAEIPAWGFDHAGWVVEPHPTPSKSVREVMQGIKVSLNQIARNCDADTKVWRAGARITSPQRAVTLGGHIHIDMKAATSAQINAYDHVTGAFEKLDILPQQESANRRGAGEYGGFSDVRTEHGHFEYRSMCSWLFSQKTTNLCITAIKLATVSPESIKRLTTIKDIAHWFEMFKGKDDDVDWILEHDYFGASLEAKPDRDIKSIWHVDPENMTGAKLVEPKAEPTAAQVEAHAQELLERRRERDRIRRALARAEEARQERAVRRFDPDVW